jgi:aminoglycoside phosphotransferase (APT) family kinase protein
MGLVDSERLEAWMDEQDLGTGTGLDIRRITSGHSNELFEIQRGGLHLALRRPPSTPLAPTAHDMAREFQVLSAIAESGHPIPIPRPERLCTDDAVIGAPFYLMEMVEGVTARHEVPAALDHQGTGRELGDALIDVLAEIHSLDWQSAGLEGFGRPAGYLDRQIARWSGQLSTYQVRALPVLEEVGAWLDGNRPPDHPPALMHGDFTMVNVMLTPKLPVRIAAVVDWEMATIGDPLVDLGWLLGLWIEPGERRLAGAEAGVTGFPDRKDMPARSHLADRYADRSGTDLSNLGWYCAFSLYKLCCVMEGSYARYVAGTSDDAHFEHLEHSIPQMAERAASFIQ